MTVLGHHTNCACIGCDSDRVDRGIAPLVACAGCIAGLGMVDSGEAGHEHYRRASGEVLCEKCGEPYRKHRHSEHVDWQGEPWLVRLCNGELVKL